MFQIDDIVLYGAEGACRITEISKKVFGTKTEEYYVLKPVYREKSTVFVPTGNEALVAKMHKALSAEEVYDIIRAMPEESTIWIEDENERKNRYREIIVGSDRKELVKLIKTLYEHRQEQQGKGRKMHLSDERFLKDAEEKLHSEFAIVLDLEPGEVLPFIMDQIQGAGGVTA